MNFLRQYCYPFGLGLVFWTGLAVNHVRADLSFSLNSQVHIQADMIKYLRDQDLVLATGQVHIQQGSIHLYADKIRYDTVAQEVHAEGHVVWQDESEEVEAQSLDYNLKTGLGKVYNIKTITPPWISYGSEVDLFPHKIVIKNAITTTCDYPEGYRHYSLKADEIDIFSGDYMVAYNVVMYIGKAPVFWFPVFVRTIHELRTPFSISTGSTSYLGTYGLLTTNYLFNPKSYGALYTDYFFNKGIGLGIHHEVALNDSQVLSLYGYGIQEKDTGNFRWEGRARMLWALSSNFTGRVEADLPGDGQFSNDYSVARRDPSLVSNFRDIQIDTTYSDSKYTLDLLLRRQELEDVNNPVITNPSNPVTLYSNFTESTQTLPQLRFSLFPQSLILKNGPKYDLTLSADHTYTQADGTYINHLTGEIGLSESLQLMPTQTFFTRVAMDEAYQDLSDQQSVTVGAGSAGETHSVNLQASWTSRVSEFLNSNLSYNFTQKLNNLFPTDPPHGITTDVLTYRLEGDVGSAFREITSTSYDFNYYQGTDAQKLNYLHQELYFTASPQFDFTLTGDYSVSSNTLKDFNSILNIRSPHDMWRFRLSANYVDPNFTYEGPVTTGLLPTFGLAGEVDFAFFTNYRFQLIENYDLTNSQFITRSISLYRDLHDWEAQINYTEDPVLGKSVFFTLNLKAFPGKPINVSNQQLQNLSNLRNQGLVGAASQFQ